MRGMGSVAGALLLVASLGVLPAAGAAPPGDLLALTVAQIQRQAEESGPPPWEREAVSRPVRAPDPLESFNRASFALNDRLYAHVLKPVAVGYGKVVPHRARVSLKRAFDNARAPVRFLNCLLQLKVRAAGEELLRFALNSTLGVGGLFDPAEALLGLEAHEEDFGQTLGAYGMGEVCYLFYPVLGPSSLRDTIGLVADNFSDPLLYFYPWAHLAIGVMERINYLSLHPDEYEKMKGYALDPYISVRNAYFQHRREEIGR